MEKVTGLLIFWAFVLTVFTTAPTYAAGISEVRQLERQVRADKRRFSDINCDIKNGKFDVTVKRTKSNRFDRAWEWGVGRSVSGKHLELTKKGFRRVVLRTVLKKGGGKVQCAIWTK